MYILINNMKIINLEGMGLILWYRSKLQVWLWRYFIFCGFFFFVLILFIFIYIFIKVNKLIRKWILFGMFIYIIFVFERKSLEEGGGVRGNGVILFF